MERSGTAVAILAVLCALHVAAAELATGTVAETGVRNWTLHDPPLELKLQQLTLDQARAFYLGRGFTAAKAERIALGCVFQTVVRNSGRAGTITLDLAQWRLQNSGNTRPIKLKSGSGKVKVQGKKIFYLGAMTAHNGTNANVPLGAHTTPSQTKVVVSP